MKPNIKEILTHEEICRLTSRSDLRGAIYVAQTWASIAAIFGFLIVWPTPITFVLAVILLGGRQLACAIIAHEAAHRTLFKTRWLNDKVADWLCARPVWLDVGRYREHHFRHHRHTGVDGDPDLSLIDPFPCTRKSMRRKLLRDVLGASGIRRIVGLVGMDLELFRYTVAADTQRAPRRRWQDHARIGVKNLIPVIVSNAALAAVLSACGAPWAYAAWALAYITTFSLFLRVRAIAEHACTERTDDYLRNTRTTRAGMLARLTVAPMHVNYHMEHHLMASVPFHQLPNLHRLLTAKGLTNPATGYVSVLALASSR